MVADPATSSPAGTAIPLTANSAQVEAVDKVPSTHSVNAVDQACRWYIAVVNNNSEKSVRDKLTALGHTCYVATQSYVRVLRSGRRVRSEQVVIRAAVFVHCSEPERRRIVAYPFIKRFMTDRAVCAKGRPATVPEREMQTLRFILGNSDSPVSIIDRPLRRGDRVRIVRGGLRGLEGEILDTGTTASGINEATTAHTSAKDSEVLIELSVLGCALLRISRLNIEPLPAPKISVAT
ncbi:UpxY family transcription antiterminator [uncultured Duncaniella sp.]|uniref:UpxY family transcription antiterminator n=1 Tax=uncultured Duncaniella sp. TaxID=2768039 RepID=UPI00272FFEA9|nr:UpxY family transcription antiterminator [uncultured Duncaniella sp.]